MFARHWLRSLVFVAIGAAVFACGAAIAKSAETQLLEFYGEGCDACVSMRSVVDRLAQAGHSVRRIDVATNRELAEQFRVSFLPCFVALQDGREVDRVEGKCTIDRLQVMVRHRPAKVDIEVKGTPTPAWRYERAVGHYSAVVRIQCKLASNAGALGSGVLVRWGERIVVLTARHVVQDAETILVRLVTGKQHAARVLVVSQWDCAVLQLDGDPVGIEPAEVELGRAAMFNSGDCLTSCGYGGPETRLAANTGLFLGYRRNAAGGDGHDDWFEMSGPARQGDSGGPIFNERGCVVGILWGTDGTTVVGVQAGRLHVVLQEATKLYRQQSDAADRPLVPVVFPSDSKRNPTPPMESQGECCPIAQCGPLPGPVPYEPSRGVDVQVGAGKKPVLPWRGDELKRDSALDAKIRSQQAEIDGLVELERARQNPPAIAETPKPPPDAKAETEDLPPLLAGLCILVAVVVGFVIYFAAQKG